MRPEIGSPLPKWSALKSSEIIYIQVILCGLSRLHLQSQEKKYLSNESNGGHEFEGLVGWGGVCVHGKGRREKKEGLK